MIFFWLSLIANTVTLLVATAAAIMRPTLIYRVIAAAAICAFLASLHQVATAQGNLPALLFNILLVALIACRRMTDLSIAKRNRRP